MAWYGYQRNENTNGNLIDINETEHDTELEDRKVHYYMLKATSIQRKF